MYQISIHKTYCNNTKQTILPENKKEINFNQWISLNILLDPTWPWIPNIDNCKKVIHNWLNTIYLKAADFINSAQFFFIIITYPKVPQIKKQVTQLLSLMIYQAKSIESFTSYLKLKILNTSKYYVATSKQFFFFIDDS